VFCPLPGWTAVRIAGADAASFLHGQFTNDVAGLEPGTTQWGGWCSPKGRLLATFALKRNAADSFVLAIPSDVAPAFVKRLRMFVLRAKVVVTPLAETHRLIGSTMAVPTLDDVDYDVLDLPEGGGGRRIAVCPIDSSALVEEALAEAALAADPVAWDQLAIRAGIPYVTAPTQDLFVPQMLNWELIGGVSFQKGCYPGQEIVARMQYLGRLKERLYRAHLATHSIADGVPVPGKALYGATFGPQSCGTVVNAAPSPADDGYELLAVIKVASAQSDTIRVGPDANAPAIRIEPLPYAVPAPKAA
jgi:folate-binding protein YgfZ